MPTKKYIVTLTIELYGCDRDHATNILNADWSDMLFGTSYPHPFHQRENLPLCYELEDVQINEYDIVKTIEMEDAKQLLLEDIDDQRQIGLFEKM